MNDFKFAFRGLLKSPGFALIAIVTLALGIGLNTSMFSLMNLILLRPLPYPDRNHLVRVYRTTPQSQIAAHAAPDLVDLVRESKDFVDLAGFRLWGYTLKQADRPAINLNAVRVSASFFPVIGMQPELGRFFTADEDRPGNHVVMLSHKTWQTQFGGDPTAIGRTVRIDGEPTVVIGVMPAAFDSVFLWGPGDAFRPLALTDTERTNRDDASLQIVGRLRAELPLAQVNARLATLAQRLAPSRPKANSEDGLRAVTLQSSVSNATTTQILVLLLGLAGFVLLIACANLANLQLSRAASRTQEFAIRAALGASRRRLLRPLLAESLLLALAGGAAGILVAQWSDAWLSSRLSANGFVTFTLELDWRVLAFALVISVLTGLVFGIVPAWLMSRVRVNDSLKSGGRGTTGDRAQHRFRHSLIVAQFALALTLLAGAGFFIRGIDGMLAREIGWRTDGLLQCVLSPPQARYATPEQTYSFYARLEERLAALPGAERVAVGWTIPVFNFLATRSYVIEGREPPPAGHEPTAFLNGITPSYFDTLGAKLVSGRNFTDADGLKAPRVAIINEALARALFPHEDPLGRRIGGLDPANRGWMQIVGVVADQKFAIGLIPPSTRFQVYCPLAQDTWNYVTVVVRSSVPETLAEPMRRIIGEMDADLPIQTLGTVQQLIALGSSGLSLVTTIMVAFAILGLFLSALGIYGVIARLVLQRTPELGVRLALGAQPGGVVWLILRSGVRLTLLGAGFGLLGAFGLSRVLAAIAPEFPGQGFLAVGLVTLLLVAVALLACWLPARRATRIDPVQALRAE